MSDTIPKTTIKKNSREEIQLSLDMFSCHTLFNMRAGYEAKDGLAFKVEKLELGLPAGRAHLIRARAH